ncbi:cysteine desulfurase family protein [Mycoplasma sp. P36-A1]|uniref:cysteine desulfurase family protein n=1 Tax=Mycoplasma sp. P36-A1 TaxID=3252900 RepID=UPI003C2D8FEC
MIYLDNAATTQLNKDVHETINKLRSSYFMNANSPYWPAIQISDLQEKSRAILAEMLNVNKKELFFLSTGSEGNNTAIKGIAFKFYGKGTKHIITSETEHSSVYETCKQLERNFGFEVTYLKPNKHGRISNTDILEAIKDNTILITIMKVNSEMGTMNYVEEIYDQIKKINRNIVVHMDCVQAFGKYELDLKHMDMASFSAHKINGVKGSALFYKKENITILPLISGGEQEMGLRAGTANYHFNIALAKTLKLFLEKKESSPIKPKYDLMIQLLQSDSRIVINSDLQNTSMYIINFSIPEYKSEVILNDLEHKDIYISTKSACSSNAKRSRVMESLPVDDSIKESAFRVSFSLYTTIEDIQTFYKELIATLDSITKG